MQSDTDAGDEQGGRTSGAARGLSFEDLEAPLLIEMAEGLTLPRDRKLALQLYLLALERCAPTHRDAIRTRIGLLNEPSSGAGALRQIIRPLEQTFGNVFVGAGLATWSKTLGFYEDERFRKLADRHAHLLPMPNWQWNLTTVLWAVKRARALDGDFVDLGVFKGRASLFCAEYVEFAEWDRRWWLYDTFDGIPDDQVDPGRAEVNATVYRGTFSFEEVQDWFAHVPNIEVVKGRVPEILGASAPDRIAFLRIDLNNAAEVVAALDALYDRIVSGAAIVLDDYGWASARAQRDAEDAWFADRGMEVLPLATGQGLVIKP